VARSPQWVVLPKTKRLPFEPGAPAGWADGGVGWGADQVTLAFSHKTIPLRMTGVAVRQRGQWRLVQVHLSAAVTDEAPPR